MKSSIIELIIFSFIFLFSSLICLLNSSLIFFVIIICIFPLSDSIILSKVNSINLSTPLLLLILPFGNLISFGTTLTISIFGKNFFIYFSVSSGIDSSIYTIIIGIVSSL